MTFKLADRYVFWWDVAAKIPDDRRSGRHVTHPFRLQFEALSQDEARAIDAEFSSLSAEERAARQHDLLYRVVLDWADVVDDEGEPVPFSRDALTRALKFPWFRLAAYDGYAAAMSGGARVGN